MQVLTPLQEARSLLEAHPGNPDPWLISGAAISSHFLSFEDNAE